MPELPTTEELARMVADLQELVRGDGERRTATTKNVSYFALGGEWVFLPAPITMASGNASSDVAKTAIDTAITLPQDAKAAVFWAGTTDACDGTGLNSLYIYGGGVRVTACQQRGTTTSDTQNNLSQVIVPGRSHEYSIDLDGATSFPFKIELIGYIKWDSA